MKIQKKQILINFLTLGYSSYKTAKHRIEAHNLNNRIVFSDQLLAFMMVIPVLAFVALAFGILDSIMVAIGFNDPELLTIIEAIMFIPHAFIASTFFHFVLGMGLIQHTQNLKEGERASVLWFGLYALDWNIPESLKAETE